MLIQLLQNHTFWQITSGLLLMPWVVFSFLGYVKLYQVFLYLLLFSSNVAAITQYGFLGFVAHIAAVVTLPLVIILADYLVSFFIWLKLHRDRNCALSPFRTFVGVSNISKTYKLVFRGDMPFRRI